MPRQKQYTERLDIPLTQKQLQDLQARAEAIGLPMTTYARMLLFAPGRSRPATQEPQPREPEPAPKE